jgi:hypothetical protein
MKKTALDELIEELENIKTTTINPRKKEGLTIAIGLAKSKYDKEEEQIKTAWACSWLAESGKEYYDKTYRPTGQLTINIDEDESK